MVRLITSLALLLFAIVTSVGQSITIHGRLTAFNTFYIPNLKVISKKANDSAVSDSLGWFHISCLEKDVIKIESKVFKPLSVRVDKGTDTLILNLVFLDTKKNRQVATGFGYISEENLSFAMNHLEAKNNDFCNYNTIFDLIEGRFPGVMVESNGSGGSIYIRGSRSAGASPRALTVVDGIIGGIGAGG